MLIVPKGKASEVHPTAQVAPTVAFSDEVRLGPVIPRWACETPRRA